MLTKRLILEWHEKQVASAEESYARELERLFVDEGKSAATRCSQLPSGLTVDQIMDRIFDPEEWNEALFAASVPSLLQVMAEGATSELMQHDLAFKILSKREVKGTQAQAFLERYNLEMPPGVDLEPPQWFMDGARESLNETFKQDYWEKINKTTRDDIRRTVTAGVEEGRTMRELAYKIEDKHGPEYGRVRALNVARTETSNASNAGHQIGMSHLEDDLGFKVGKQWLSALMSTTRDSHAAMDGVTVEGADGLFKLGGVEVPYPGHFSLPAGERVNCLCTTISDIVGEAATQPTGGEFLEEPDYNELATHKVDKILSENQRLQDKTARVLEAASKHQAEKARLYELNAKYGPEARDLEYEAGKLHDRKMELLASESEVVVVDGEAVVRAKPLTQEMKLEFDRLEKEAEQLEARAKEAKKKWAEVGDNIRKLEAMERQDVLEQIALSADDQIQLTSVKSTGHSGVSGGLKESTGVFDSAMNDSIDESLSFLSKLTGRGRSFVTGAGEDIDAKILKKATTVQFHSAQPGTRAFQRTSPNPTKSGVYITKSDKAKAYVHEVGHHLEEAIPGVKSRANEFLDYRLAKSGKPDIKLNSKFPGFRDDEFGNDDDFQKTFNLTGIKAERPSAFYVGKRYMDGSTEVISMGVELLFEDPAGFATRDPEYFKFILGVLDGTIRR